MAILPIRAKRMGTCVALLSRFRASASRNTSSPSATRSTHPGGMGAVGERRGGGTESVALRCRQQRVSERTGRGATGPGIRLLHSSPRLPQPGSGRTIAVQNAVAKGLHHSPVAPPALQAGRDTVSMRQQRRSRRNQGMSGPSTLSTTTRARSSASKTGMPRVCSSLAKVLFPLAMPPVNPTNLILSRVNSDLHKGSFVGTGALFPEFGGGERAGAVAHQICHGFRRGPAPWENCVAQGASLPKLPSSSGLTRPDMHGVDVTFAA